MDYLVVVSAPARRLSPTRFAMDGAFAAHLRALMKHLSPHFSRLLMAAPELSAEHYERVKDAFSVIDESSEPIAYVTSYPANAGAARAALHLPSLIPLVRDADFVHTHLADPLYPHSAVAGFLALAFKKRLMLVSDLDERGFADRERAARRIGLRDYLWRTFVSEPLNQWQQRTWVRHADLVLYKEYQQAEDFGRGAPHVRFFLDPHYDTHQVIESEQLEKKLTRLHDKSEPLRVLFFGRLVAAKGVDVMLEAVAAAKRAGANLTFDIMGAGPHKARLESLAAAHRLDVRWLPPRPYADGFLDTIREYDLLLACPRVADTARSAWDAIASGVAVLAYDTKYYRNVDRLTGGIITTPEHDLRALCDRLIGIATDKSQLAPKIRHAVEVARANSADVWLGKRASWIRSLFVADPRPDAKHETEHARLDAPGRETRDKIRPPEPLFLVSQSPCGPAKREHV
jgi:glycosyltransferase involved in cell wall biosynthesis